MNSAPATADDGRAARPKGTLSALQKAQAARRLRTLSLLACFGMAVAFGLTFPAQKAALNFLPPLTVTALRNLFAAAALWPFWRRWRRRGGEAIPWRRLWPLLLLEPGLYYACEAYGVRLGSAGAAALLIGAIPVEVLLLQILLGRHRARLLDFMLLGVSLGGAVLVAGMGGFSGGGSADARLAALLMFGASSCAALYVVISEGLQPRPHPLTLTFAQCLAGTAIFVPLALLFEPAARAPRGWPLPALGATLFLGLGGSLLAYLLWNYALRHRPGRQVALFSNLVPVVGVAGGALLLHERLRSAVFFGGALIVAAAVLAVWLDEIPPVAETA